MIDHSLKKLFSFIFPLQLLLRSICASVQESQPIEWSVCLLVQTSVYWSACWTGCTFACEPFNCIQRSTCFWILSKGFLLTSPYIFFQVYLRISIRGSIPWLVQPLVRLSLHWSVAHYIILLWFSLFSPHCIFFQSFTFSNSPLVASYFIKEVNWLIYNLTARPRDTDRQTYWLTMRSMRRVLGHLLIRSLICLHHLLIHLLRTDCCAHLLPSSLTPKLIGERFMFTI